MQSGARFLIWHGVARWVLAAAALLACVSVWAGGGAVIPEEKARQWLLRMHNAAIQRNYQGTLVVTAGGSMQSSRVLHYCVGNLSLERVDVLDGQPRQVLRHNEQVLTLWPAARVARLEQRDAVQPFPALLTGNEDQLFDRYEMVAEAPGRVAGFNAAVFLMRPRDDWRFAQRIWAEQASGLLLRADVLAPDGRVLETSAFSDLTIGTTNRPESVQAALRHLDGWRVSKSIPQHTGLEAEGWQLKVPVQGFRQASCVKRSLDAAHDDPRDGVVEAVQAVYTDGLTYVSLFIEPLRTERHRAGSATVGATHTWMQAQGSHWITVMGDVPLATLQQFAAALERKR
jgi:sigma-E factor negative regulatory protein RseB